MNLSSFSLLSVFQQGDSACSIAFREGIGVLKGPFGALVWSDGLYDGHETSLCNAEDKDILITIAFLLQTYLSIYLSI